MSEIDNPFGTWLIKYAPIKKSVSHQTLHRAETLSTDRHQVRLGQYSDFLSPQTQSLSCTVTPSL